MEAAISRFGKHDDAMTQVHLKARRLVQQTQRLLTTGTQLVAGGTVLRA